MNWLFFALLAQAIYTVNIFIDKYLISRLIKNYLIVPIYMSIVGLIAGLVFFIATGFPVLPAHDALIVLTTGAITTWGAFFYFKALSDEEASSIVIFVQIVPVITLILGYIFLKELITIRQFIGFALVLFATLLIAVEGNLKDFKVTKALFFILVADTFWALGSVLMKFAINATSFAKVLSYESWGIALGGLFVYLALPSIRKAFEQNVRSLPKKALGVIATNEILFVLAKALVYFAITLGPVALVSVVSGTQVFYGILFGVILGYLAPSIFKEELNSKDIVKKIVAAGLLFGGLFLVY